MNIFANPIQGERFIEDRLEDLFAEEIILLQQRPGPRQGAGDGLTMETDGLIVIEAVSLPLLKRPKLRRFYPPVSRKDMLAKELRSMGVHPATGLPLLPRQQLSEKPPVKRRKTASVH